jgi:hypothetical protein
MSVLQRFRVQRSIMRFRRGTPLRRVRSPLGSTARGCAGGSGSAGESGCACACGSGSAGASDVREWEANHGFSGPCQRNRGKLGSGFRSPSSPPSPLPLPRLSPSRSSPPHAHAPSPPLSQRRLARGISIVPPCSEPSRPSRARPASMIRFDTTSVPHRGPARRSARCSLRSQP